MSNELTAMVHDLRALKDKKDELEASLKEINGDIRLLAEKKIPEYMDENEIEKISVEGVGTCFLQTKIYANVKNDDKEAFFGWLREHGNGDLIKETVHPSTLNAFAKEQLTKGEALPDVLSARLYPTATLRRK